MFGVNLGADKEGNPEVIPDPAEKKAPAPSSGPRFNMDDMDTSGPTETKKQKQEEKMETQEIPKEDNSKEEAKKVKEEGNAHYKKKELDLAIAKYDEVIKKIATKFASRLTK
mgnify:CR=1 FL=1